MGLNLDLFKPIKQIYFSRTCLTHKKIVKIAQNFGSDGHFEMMCLTSLMPCPFTGPKMFCASPNFLYHTKNLFIYCASHKHFVPEQKMICIQ